MTSYYAEVPYDEAFNWTELELPEDDGGFTMYWYGVPNPETGMNPATLQHASGGPGNMQSLPTRARTTSVR